MREILYLQAGNYSNYVGTHFWNTQREYAITDKGDQVDDNISFTQRHDPDGTDHLYPRAIIFDWKDNFGTLSQSNALGTGTNETQSSDASSILWDRPVDEFRQTRIAASTYHAKIEEDSLDQSQTAVFTQPGNIRYWSDYSHVYCLPRSIQRVPSPPSPEGFEGNWKQSQDQFWRYNEDNDLMDTSIRLFLEECDNIQGVQLINDVSTFGGFSEVLLTQLKDEFMNVPTFAFPILSTGAFHEVDIEDNRGTCQVINEALYLRGVAEHATLSIPIHAPQNWPEKAWLGSHNTKSAYFSSSIISAHVESVTFFSRAKRIQEDIGIVGAQLSTADGLPPFAEISGVIPVDKSTNIGHSLVNFTVPTLERSQKHILYSVRDVVRGFGSLDQQNYRSWMGETVTRLEPEILQTFGFPLTGPLRTASPLHGSDTASTLSRLSTSSNLEHMFKNYASFIEASLRRRTAGVMSMGIDTDDIRELINDLWSAHDRYPTNGEGSDLGNNGGSGDE
ncbi:tubulin nucleotide-binding domain-like protein [Macrolepiota fuliginosa MF-IS2]|uniref:Tubulin nucleotide-binding domain-like protein n=1 Tax=Macrolepiota fuliginosa MF-IS2 TaxID=1400762 RepID=A0A9P5X861_9AGAR|nr:tubulin nucleotide-binding domain-like protein [Macrolepiota fuliginosa MF-IS2]